MLRSINYGLITLLVVVTAMVTACGGAGSSTTAVSGGGDNAGTLNIAIESATLYAGESTVVTVTLSGATGVSNLTIDLTSSESSIAVLGASSCVIAGSSSGQNTCSVGVTAGTESGSSIITASAATYQDTTATLNVARHVFAYVSDANQNQVYKCSVNVFGGISACVAQDALNTAGAAPNHVVFHTTNGTTYAYIATNGIAGGQLFICAVVGGDLSACADSGIVNDGDSQPILPNAIAFATESGITKAYLTTGGNAGGNTFYCAINTATGGLEACNANATTFSSPTYITFALISGVNTAFVLNQYTGFLDSSIYKCSVLAGGENGLDTCASAQGVTTKFINPTSMDFRTESSPLVYVTESSAVKFCDLLESGGRFTGDLLTCSTTPRESAPDWSPASITINRAPDTLYYGYVSDTTNGHLYNCSATVLSLDGLSGCKIESAVTSWQPTGVAFLTTP